MSKFGWPLVDRREELLKLLTAEAAGSERIPDFQGQALTTLKVIRVPINLPKYRIANGRTASAQQEHVATHGLPIDYFENADADLEELQIAQHNLLLGMIREEGLEKKFIDGKNRQVNPLLADADGFVVNGNRRLCCWRHLFDADPTKYAHFSHVDVAVLPRCDDHEIDRIEARLQVEKDIRSDYVWHAEANMVSQKMRLNTLSTPEIARLYGKSNQHIENLLAKRELAIEYLAQCGTPFKWSAVSDANFLLEAVIKGMRSLPAKADRELFKRTSFLLIGNADEAAERLYSVVSRIKEHLSDVRRALSEEFPAIEEETDRDAIEAFGGRTPINDGGLSDSVRLVAAISSGPEAEQRAREVLLEVVRSQEAQLQDANTAAYLLKTLRKANSLVQNATAHGLRPETQTDGVTAQIQALRSQLDRIDLWLKARGR
jgi:hypothetical protein